MTLLFLLLIALALGAGFVMMVMQDPGYVLITLKPWSIELSLALFLLLMLVLFVALYFLFRTIVRLWQSPRDFGNWRSGRQQDKARQLQTRGIMRVIEGDWDQAERHLLSYVAQTDTPALNYLGAAHAAQGRGDLKKRDEYLAQAIECQPDQTTAIGLTKATLQYRSGQYDQADETLRALREKNPKNGRVLALSLKVLEQVEDWGTMQKLIPAARKYASAPAAEIDRLQQISSRQLLSHATTDDDLQRQWRAMSREQRNSPEAIGAYAERLIEQGSQQQAEELLRKAINRNWNPQLVRIYGRVRRMDAAAQLKYAEKWLAEHKDSPELMLSLAQISLNNELWGKARDYLEACIGVGGTVEAYRELGHLLEQLDEKEQALDLYRQGIDQASPPTGDVKRIELSESDKAKPDEVKEGELI